MVNIYTPVNPDISPYGGLGHAQWAQRTLPIYNEQDLTLGGQSEAHFPFSVRSLFIERVERQCIIYAGTGKQYFLGEYAFGMQKSFQFPSGIDEVTVEWIPDAEILDRVPVPEPYEQPENPVLKIWFSDQLIHYDSFHSDGQSAKIVRSQTVWSNNDRQMTEGIRRATTPFKYGVSVINPSRPYRIATVFAAADNVLVGALWIPDANQDVIVRIHKIEVGLYSTLQASEIYFFLTALNGSDANWSGGTITPQPIGPVFSPNLPFCRWRTTPNAGNMPTTVNAGQSFVGYRAGITAASSTVSPPPVTPMEPLFYDDTPDGMDGIHFGSNTGVRGIGILLDSSAATTVFWFARVLFSEYREKVEPLEIGNIV